MNRVVVRLTMTATATTSGLQQFARFRARNYQEPNLVVSFKTVDVSNVTVDHALLNIFDVRKKEVPLVVFGGNNNVVRYIKILVGINKWLRTFSGDVIIHIHQPAVGSLASLLRLLGLFRRARWIYTLHNTFAHYSLKNKALTVIACLSSDIVTCIGKSVRESLPQRLLTLRGQKILTIQNGVDLARIDGLQKHAIRLSGSNLFMILAVARLQPVKRIDVILRACATLNVNWRLRICGEGPLRAELESLSRILDISERVEFLGVIEREAVYHEMAAADIFVSPSSWEGLPVAALEAMGSGLSVILSDIPAHTEISSPGAGPILVRQDVDAVSEKLKYLAAMMSEQRHAIGILNRALVEKNFSLVKSQEQWSELYSELFFNKEF